MPKVRMDYRLKQYLDGMIFSRPPDSRFCSEFDVIVDFGTDDDAFTALFVAWAFHKLGMSDPHVVD